MKVLTIYEADDGTRFDKAEDAYRRDKLHAEVRAIEETLPPRPDASDERVEVASSIVWAAKSATVHLCRREYPTQKVFQYPPEQIHPHSFAGRFLDDQRNPLTRIWYWFQCERDGWLYNQPFFALNPDKFTPRNHGPKTSQ